MTPVHYCRAHIAGAAFDLAGYLTAERRTLIERLARKVRGPSFRPDFEQARIVPVLVTTPEYRAALASMGERRRATAA